MMFKLDRGLFLLVSALSFAACRGDEGDTSASSSSSSAGTDSNSSTGEGTPTTTGATDSTSGSGSGDGTTTTGDTPTTTNNSAGFITTATDSSGDTNTGPLPNGSQCASDDDCESMNCFSTLGGMVAFCADCNEDQDCVDAGTGIGCTPDLQSQSAVCTQGELGDGCQTDAACMGDLHCAPVIDSGGLLPTTFCGECAESSDCMNGQLCSPKFNAMSFDGNTACVDPGSVPNNDLCPDGQDGDAACMSGHCETISVMGLLQVPVCGECSSDADCMNGETCTPGEVGMTGIAGSTCDAP